MDIGRQTEEYLCTNTNILNIFNLHAKTLRFSAVKLLLVRKSKALAKQTSR